MDDHTLLFIAGLHRSGTSLLFQCLREHPQISGFCNTGVPEDEGQHLQDVYRPAREFGGAGRFGFAAAAHLTESSPLATPENAQRLLACWSPHWNLHRPVLMEKSPQNLLQTRLLQRFFPGAAFLVVLRHPVAVALATQKWRRDSLYRLLEHWLVCHELLHRDLPQLGHVHVLRYEDFVAAPQNHLDTIAEFLNLPRHRPSLAVRPDVNRRYFQMWEAAQRGAISRRYLNDLIARFESRCNCFGYSLVNLDAVGDVMQSSTLPAASVWRSPGLARLCQGLGDVRGTAWSWQKFLRKRLRSLLQLQRARSPAVH